MSDANSDVTTGLSELERAWDFFFILKMLTSEIIDYQNSNEFSDNNTRLRKLQKAIFRFYLFASFADVLLFFLPLSIVLDSVSMVTTDAVTAHKRDHDIIKCGNTIVKY